MSRLIWVGIGLILPALLAGCGEPVATREPKLVRMAGAASMLPLVEELADAYGERAPLVRFQATGMGSVAALEALRQGAADVVLASWLPSEAGEGTKATAVARDAIAVIVHPSNPVGGLGLLQLRNVFAGRLNVWSTVVGASSSERVQPVSRERGSGTRTAFESLVMDDTGVTPTAIQVPSGDAVVDYVASNPQAVGYVSHAQVTERVKAITIEGVEASASTARLGSYPITRELWLVTMEAPAEEVERFVGFCLGPEGQEIVGLRYGRVD